jgi:hypothetical protein
MRAPSSIALLVAVLTVVVAVPAFAADPAGISCDWRAKATEGTADNPAGDPGSPWDAGRRLTDPSWRSLDEHFQQFHFGLWTAGDLAALEQTPGVALAVLHPLPAAIGPDGRLVRPEEAAVVQWPDHISPSDMVLVAIANARPGEDWVLYPVATGGAPYVAPPAPLVGPATAAGDPGATGFYRVHRLVADARRWSELSWEARRVEVNPLELETELALLTESAGLTVPPGASASRQVLASGTFSVRSRSSELLEAPVVVNLSLRGPGSDLFTLEVLPAGGEPVTSGAHNVRVTDTLDFLVTAPPSTLSGSAFIDQLLPPGQALVIEVVAEIVSFANEVGEELDVGLSSTGFSVAAGDAVVFPPVSLLPRDLVQRSTFLEVWRAPPAMPEEQ